MIKKTLALSLIFFGAAASVSGAPVYIEKGINIGLNLSSLSGRGLDLNWNIKAGLTAGVTLTFPLADFFAIQPGIFYSQKGARYQETFEEGTVRTTMVLNYLDIPVVARLSLPQAPEAGIRPYIMGGASYSLKLTSKIRTDLIDYYETPLEEGDVEGLKKSGINLVLGAGVDFLSPNGRFLFEVRYSRSLQTISTEGPDIRLNVFSIIAGFSF